jgi:two-component system, NarL family, invasion response regulator UvrY
MDRKILLADDHSLIRKGLRLLFESLGYKEVGEVASCNDLMKELAQKKYTHLVLDINLSDGSILEVLPNIHRLYNDLRITILSMQPEIYGKVLKKYGISHYISKNAPEEETIRMLRQFLQNNQPEPENIRPARPESPFLGLTQRELEILHYMLQGRRTNEIAQTLNLKGNTISTVKNRIYEKTMATNLIELKVLASLYELN